MPALSKEFHHNFKHGHWVGKKASLTYCSWRSMMNRCYMPKNNRFHAYGAKGITVYDQWHDFIKFLEDMGERPTSKHTIDRIDSSEGYFPGNVRWATKSQQAVNRKTTRFFTIDGETKCLKHWAKQYKIDYIRVYRRVFQLKWDLLEALTTPVKNKKLDVSAKN